MKVEERLIRKRKGINGSGNKSRKDFFKVKKLKNKNKTFPLPEIQSVR